MNLVTIPLDKIYLDPKNYRLRSHPNYKDIPDLTDEKIVTKALQQRTTNLVVGKNNIEIKDIIDSFKSNGYLRVDNILVRKLDNIDDSYVVIEGNRRVAALKILQQSYSEGFEVGILNTDIFSSEKGIEVVVYNYETSDEYLILMGLRHVSGNKKWDRYNQAKLISELDTNGYSVEDIANKLGISNKRVVQDQLDAYHAIQAFIDSEYAQDFISNYNPHDKFMLFVEVLLKRKMKQWLEWDNRQKKFLNTANLNRFYSWVTPTYAAPEEDDEGLNEGEYLDPIIVNHKEIRLLDEIIEDDESLDILEETRSVNEAVEQNDGYTKKKFAKEIKRAEGILRNIKIGPALSLDSFDLASLQNIKRISERLLNENN